MMNKQTQLLILGVTAIVIVVIIYTHLQADTTKSTNSLSMDQLLLSSPYNYQELKNLQLTEDPVKIKQTIVKLPESAGRNDDDIHNRMQTYNTLSHFSQPPQQTTKSESHFQTLLPPNLPWGKMIDKKLTLKSLAKQSWVENLKTILRTKMDTRFPVAITTSSFSYRSSLLNWLGHALIPTDDAVRNILILSLDEKLHSFLIKKNISSLYLPPFVGSQQEGIFCVEVARLTVMRFMNFWGYDIVNYDSDAFILKNPQSLFELYPESHVIGSEAYMPDQLHKKWGVTLCMGMVYIRASPEAEQLWAAMSKHHIRDDQVLLNYGLNTLGVNFASRSNTNEPWKGKSRPLGSNLSATLDVTVIPMNKICRGQACKLDIIPGCYVWHQGGNHKLNLMKKNSVASKVWLLRDNWESLGKASNLTGADWLRRLIRH